MPGKSDQRTFETPVILSRAKDLLRCSFSMRNSRCFAPLSMTDALFQHLLERECC